MKKLLQIPVERTSVLFLKLIHLLFANMETYGAEWLSLAVGFSRYQLYFFAKDTENRRKPKVLM
jgi:hypothetical protein